MDRGGAFSTNWIRALFASKKLLDHLRLTMLESNSIYHILPIPKNLQTKHPRYTPALLWWGFITLLGALEKYLPLNKCVEVREWLIQNYPEVTKISHEYMLSLRSDNRRDAVHSCVPGWWLGCNATPSHCHEIWKHDQHVYKWFWIGVILFPAFEEDGWLTLYYK